MTKQGTGGRGIAAGIASATCSDNSCPHTENSVDWDAGTLEYNEGDNWVIETFGPMLNQPVNPCYGQSVYAVSLVPPGYAASVENVEVACKLNPH